MIRRFKPTPHNSSGWGDYQYWEWHEGEPHQKGGVLVKRDGTREPQSYWALKDALVYAQQGLWEEVLPHPPCFEVGL